MRAGSVGPEPGDLSGALRIDALDVGHAIVSPGWRPTWRGIAQTWCSAQITDADLPLLEGLRHASADWRLESAAEDLIRITKNRNGSGDEPENSIFNPRNSAYVLKDGCGAER